MVLKKVFLIVLTMLILGSILVFGDFSVEGDLSGLVNPSVSPSPGMSLAPTPSSTVSATPTLTPTTTGTVSTTPTPTPTVSGTPTSTPSVTSTTTPPGTPTLTPSPTPPGTTEPTKCPAKFPCKVVENGIEVCKSKCFNSGCNYNEKGECPSCPTGREACPDGRVCCAEEYNCVTMFDQRSHEATYKCVHNECRAGLEACPEPYLGAGCCKADEKCFRFRSANGITYKCISGIGCSKGVPCPEDPLCCEEGDVCISPGTTHACCNKDKKRCFLFYFDSIKKRDMIYETGPECNTKNDCTWRTPFGYTTKCLNECGGRLISYSGGPSGEQPSPPSLLGRIISFFRGLR